MKYNKQDMIEALKHSIEVAEEKIEELKKPKMCIRDSFQIVPLILLFWNRFDVYLRDKQETQERMKLKKLSKFD